MKIKLDYVTNSSSTAFYFIFKGNKESLIKLLNEGSLYFFANQDDTLYTSGDIAGAISHLIKDEIIEQIELILNDGVRYGNRLTVLNIEHLINETENRIAKMKTWDDSIVTWDDEIAQMEDFRARIIRAKEAGLTNYLEVEFGDNHGDIVGALGTAMAYNFHDTITKNLVILTENRH